MAQFGFCIDLLVPVFSYTEMMTQSYLKSQGTQSQEVKEV